MEWEAGISICQCSVNLRSSLWVYCPGHAGVKGNDRAERLAGEVTPEVIIITLVQRYTP